MDLTVHIPDEAVPALKAIASGFRWRPSLNRCYWSGFRTNRPQHQIRRLLRPRGGLGHLVNVMVCP